MNVMAIKKVSKIIVVLINVLAFIAYLSQRLQLYECINLNWHYNASFRQKWFKRITFCKVASI